jgi:hypothetical protein
MFVVETVIWVGLACAARRMNGADQSMNFDSTAKGLIINTGNAKMPEILIADPLEIALGKDFAGIPQVRHVLTEWVDGPLLVWIAIDNIELDVRRKVYQKELELMDGFPNIEFDFNLVPALDRDPEELASGAHVVFSRQG